MDTHMFGGMKTWRCPTRQALRCCVHKRPVWGHTVPTWVLLLGTALLKTP